MKNIFLLATFLFLIGAGCNSTTGPQTKSAGEVIPEPITTSTPETLVVPEIPSDSAIVLTAEALGNQTVRVAFELPAEMKKGADMYRLLISTNEKPTRENATNWYDLNTAHQTKDWNVSLIGHRYVRVCVVREAKCTEYSNIVPVNVR